jgi:hypothetical protein
MDSMRSLNTSLPGTAPISSRQQEPPEQLLTAFKAAALSVTNLYKSAAADQGRARSEGYQDALDELLAFLDKEDIGLSDGEGWRVRRWATERLDGRDSISQNMESDDEASEKASEKDRGSSPILQRSQSATRMPPAPNTARNVSPVRTESPSVPAVTATTTTDSTPPSIPPQTTFTFRSSHAYPQDADIILSDLELSDNSRTQSHDGSVTSHAATTTASGHTITRPPRTRHNNHSARVPTRPSNNIGRGAGQKRKINFGDFFDIGNIGHGKDGFGGGGKRGRFA